MTAVSRTAGEHCARDIHTYLHTGTLSGGGLVCSGRCSVGDKLAEEGFLGVQSGRRGATVGRVVLLQIYSTSVVVFVCMIIVVRSRKDDSIRIPTVHKNAKDKKETLSDTG